MVRGAACAMLVAAACVWYTRASVLVPKAVLPPDSFIRDQRSLSLPPDGAVVDSRRSTRRLVGGHMKIRPGKEFGNPTKNSFAFDEKSDGGKFDQATGAVGRNQGIWDDGMLMSSAGEGKEPAKKGKDDDEDKKTLSDQVAEGKYGLIQNEIFSKPLKQPGIVSYEANSETRSKDNAQNLGGLKKEEIWLAEDHLLVLKGGSFPERSKDLDRKPWPPIDNYEAPRRQVKLPLNPKVPPPFPVQLTDDGPLVFLTPNGSVPASLFPDFPPAEGENPLPPPPYPEESDYAQGDDADRNTKVKLVLPFVIYNTVKTTTVMPDMINLPPFKGPFPEGYPPTPRVPPQGDQGDLYEEDDPSIYYPPPYNFSYRAENSSVPAGPLVPGIVLPPPPDFFAPLDENVTTTKEITTSANPTSSTTTTTTTKDTPTVKRPSPTSTYRKPYKRPTTESPRTTEVPSTIPTTPPVEITTSKQRQPSRVVQIPQRNNVRVHNLPVELQTRPKTAKPVYKTRQKVTSKPLSVSVIYDYPDEAYRTKTPTTSQRPYVFYNVPEQTDNLVTSTPVPLRAYFSNTQSNNVPTTKLQPVYNQNENAVASFYFYDEQPKTTAAPVTYFDSGKYYNAVALPQTQQNVEPQRGFTPSVDVAYGAIDQTDNLYLWPQKHGPRTLTQEYFSIQKPKTHEAYVQQNPRPNAFYQQIADIQQTIDFFTTKRPKSHQHGQRGAYKPKAITSRPVYQYSYQSQPPPTFRAPKLDPEPFRPMVSYSKPFNVQNDFNAVTPSTAPVYHQQYLIENVRVTTESPTQHNDKENAPLKKHKHHIATYDDRQAIHTNAQAQRYPHTTPNPISHGYYTKQDERYFDDITKNSFDIFGKKIEDDTRDVSALAVTPPLGTVRTPIDNNINLQYAYEIVESQSPNPPSLERDTEVNNRLPPPVDPDSEPVPPQIRVNSQLVQPPKPPSLADDTLVNDRLPRPTINPDSEFLPIPNPKYRSSQYNEQPQYAGEQYDLNRPSLAGDTAVNYARPLPPVNPNAEWVSPVNTAGEGRPGSFVSYQLPGDGAHVYFLTPQAARNRYRSYRSPVHGR